MAKRKMLYVVNTHSLAAALSRIGMTEKVARTHIGARAQVHQSCLTSWFRRICGVSKVNRGVLCDYLACSEEYLFDNYLSTEYCRDGKFVDPGCQAKAPISEPKEDRFVTKIPVQLALKTSPDNQPKPHLVMIAYSKAPADIQEAVAVMLGEFL